MPHYQAVGSLPRKRHIQFRQPNGTLYHEELMGKEGFSSDSSLLYHVNPPTAVLDAREWDLEFEVRSTNTPLLPRHFKTHKLDSKSANAVTGRQLLLSNSDVRISYCLANSESPLYRNASGDECIFVEEGEATLDTIYGQLNVTSGDYVVIPMSTTHRWIPTSKLTRLLIIEASGHIEIPRKYRSASGQLMENAPFSERDLKLPHSLTQHVDTDIEVYVRQRNGGTIYRYSNHPFDIVGWDGCLYPYAFSIFDFEPIVGRIHLPPPVHQTFEGPNFVICSFCPRPFDFDSEAIPVPYNHANIDSDEVLFYMAGDFMSRGNAGIEPGSISLHPSGFIHGPQPGVVEASLESKGTEEYAVMIDTFSPLELGEAASQCEDPSYMSSWLSKV